MESPEVSQVLQLSTEAAGERALQQCGLVDIAEDLVHGRAGALTIDAERLDFPKDARPASQSDGHGGTGMGERGASVVESPVAAQPVDRGVNLVVSEPPLSKSLANLCHRELTACEPAERSDVWVLRKLFLHSRIAVLRGSGNRGR